VSPPFALSTVWMHNRFSRLRDFFSAAEAAGFANFELDASISLQAIADQSLPEGQILSLEIPCPTHPKQLGARLASLDRYEREAARQAALNSFQLAEDIRAQVLIANLGRVDVSPKLEQAYYEARQRGGPEADNVRDLQRELTEMRARNAPLHLNAALYDLEYLANQAAQSGLKVAIVTPTRFLGFPLPEELHILLEEFGDPIYYWHDAGQGQIFDHLGLVSSAAWLAVGAERLVGLHLYDVSDRQRWLVPQANGAVDFEKLKQYLTEETILTGKFSAGYEPDEITTALTWLKNRLS